jgi:hypothetical protein
MTSRRSKNNSTTDDWRSQKDDLYFDSTWPADSQGRKKPASTQITVTPSASILETSRAAQAANRDKLDRRDNVGKIETEATRLIKKDQSGRQQNKNEITRGVPENEIRTVLPKRRSVGGDFAWIIQEFKYKTGASGERLGVLGSELSASSNISSLPSPFEVYRFFIPLELGQGQPFQLPASYTTYDKATPFPAPETLIHFPVIESTKDRLYFEVSATLQGQGSAPWIEGVQSIPYMDKENHAWQLGLFFNSRKLSKSSYVYFFAKKIAPEDTSLLELRNVDEGFYTLASLDPESKYPQPTYISGDPAKIYIERIEFTPVFKNNAMENYSDTFGNPTQKRTFEWNRPGPHRIEGEVGAKVQKIFFELGNSVVAQFIAESVTFHDQIELIYTDKDYGELIWAE